MIYLSIYDLTITWFPSKLNSLLFQGKDGDIFKEFLVSVLFSNCSEQTKVFTDCLSPTVADALPETTEPPLAKSIETVSENSVDFNPTSPKERLRLWNLCYKSKRRG